MTRARSWRSCARLSSSRRSTTTRSVGPGRATACGRGLPEHPSFLGACWPGGDDLLGRMSVRPQYRSRQFPEPAVLEWHQLARLGSPSGDVLAAFEIIPAVDVDLFPVSPKSAGSGSARRDRLNGSLKKKKRGRGLSACRADRDGARAEAAHDARHPRRHPPRHARHAHSGMDGSTRYSRAHAWS